MNLLELVTHLEEKAAQLRCECLGRIKIALVGMDTCSVLEILQGYFGQVDVDTAESTMSAEEPDMKSTTEEKTSAKTSEKTSDILEKLPTTLQGVGGLATVEMVFPRIFPKGSSL